MNCYVTNLVERLDLGVHDERELAQLARVRLGRRKPLLQTGLVHVLEAARAVARRQQRVLGIGLAVADPADVAAALGRVAAAGTVSVRGKGRKTVYKLFFNSQKIIFKKKHSCNKKCSNNFWLPTCRTLFPILMIVIMARTSLLTHQ